MSVQATIKEATLDQALDLGLLKEEFEKIKNILGRTPNFTEMSIFSGKVTFPLKRYPPCSL